MKKIFLVSIVIIISVLQNGCTSTTTLNEIQTSNIYTNKLKLKVGLYVPSEIKEKSTVVGTSTIFCGAWKAQIASGNGYYSAIRSGLSSSVENVQLSNSPIDSELAQTEGFDLYVVPQIVNENASVSVVPTGLAWTIKSQFQTSISLKFIDSKGDTIYYCNLNGSGFNTGKGSCSDIADVIKLSMETGLRQITDNISETIYNSGQINAFAKSKK